ncbi:D-2-hydroxyacid dehydrogenase [Mesorhizobium sp. 1B3]|uniref:D-2-hydroxyacid dehydrogenase n=1 Tax=Mesorhizobium sp. 1B3 TaxID=3243599 RepID=UPI003D97875B
MVSGTQKLKIVALDRDTLPIAKLRTPNFPHILIEHGKTAAGDTRERIADADVVITNKVRLTEADLSTAIKLKFVAIAATGTDIVDLGACAAMGVAVSNIRGYSENSVPQHTIALMLALSRSIVPYCNSVARGGWAKSEQFSYFDYPIEDLNGKTLGIIGDGMIGRSVGRIAEALGMRILFAAHKGRSGMGSLYTPFDDLLRTSDVITLHAPLTAATKHMIAEADFDLMLQRPLLINTSRGGLISETALVQALKDGRISGAALDVVAKEPMPDNHPYMKLLHQPNFILTPHVAWASKTAVAQLTEQLIANIEAWHTGEPRNLVI